MQQERPEVIVCAAIKYLVKDQKTIDMKLLAVDLVIPMVRHYSPDGRDVLDQVIPVYENKEIYEKEQGFITNYGRFVDRKEALAIAKQNNQIKYGIGYEQEELYSEMLY